MPYNPNYAPISGSFISSASLAVASSANAPIGGFKGIYVGNAGTVPVVGDNSVGAVFNATAGSTIWVSGRYVDSSGTVGTLTASGLVGLR